MPGPVLPEITLPAPVPVVDVNPPIVLPETLVAISTPSPLFAQRGGAGGVRADVVADHQVCARSSAADRDTPPALAEMILRAAAVVPPIVLPEEAP